jgi:hypothetical protein
MLYFIFSCLPGIKAGAYPSPARLTDRAADIQRRAVPCGRYLHPPTVVGPL